MTILIAFIHLEYLLRITGINSDIDMQRCEGRPNRPCPLKVNNASVSLSQGDLMLCKDCEIFRFPHLKDNKASTSATALALETMSSSTVEMEVSGSLTDGIPSASINKSDKLIICELLFFAINNFDKHPSEVLKTVISEFYREDEILSAKTTLVQEIPQDVKGPSTEKYVKGRIGCHKVKNSVDDILSLLDVIDSNGMREKLPIFCAANMARISTLPDELSDLTNMRYELNELRKQVELLSSYIRPPPLWKVESNSDEGEQRRVNMDKDFPPLNNQDGVQHHVQYESSNEQSRKPTIHSHPQSDVAATNCRELCR